MAKVSIKIDGKTLRAAAEFAGVIFDIGRYFTERNSQKLETASSPYEVLGVSLQATNEEIKQRYRQLAKVYHPDKPAGYEPAMKLLNEAYNEICEQRQIKA